jgi:hypothetical protein
MDSGAHMNTFQVGATYTGRSICDSECVYRMRVLRRTAKTITVSLNEAAPKTLRPYLYRDCETVMPNGRYSMALTIGADKMAA